jgi:hypothetical protein
MTLKLITYKPFQEAKSLSSYGEIMRNSSRARILGYETAQICGRIPTFRRSMLPPSTWCHNPEDGDLILQCRENLKYRV